MDLLQSEQLELSLGEPFSVRLRIDFALPFWNEHYWKKCPKGRNTQKAVSRVLEFFRLHKIIFVDELARHDIEKLRDWLKEQRLKANTINTHHGIVINWLNRQYEWQEAGEFEGVNFSKCPLPRRNPASQVRRVDEKIFARNTAWTKRMVLKLIDAANRLGDGLMADSVEILYATRLRPGDLLAMTEKNVNLVRLFISGVQHKTVTRRLPSGIPYLLALTERTAKILKRRMEAVGPGEPLFSMGDREMQRRFHIVRLAAGMPFVQRRDMRPSSATLLLDNGIDSLTTQESLGHTTERMLPSYAPRKLIHQRKAQEVLEREDTEILI